MGEMQGIASMIQKMTQFSPQSLYQAQPLYLGQSLIHAQPAMNGYVGGGRK